MMKNKILLIIVLIPVAIYALLCIFNTSYGLYVDHQANIAYTKMQKVVDEHNYKAINLAPIQVKSKMFTIYAYTSSFSNQNTLDKNRKLFNHMGYKVKKYDDIDTPFRYSISASKTKEKWTFYIREEPFGTEKKYYVN